MSKIIIPTVRERFYSFMKDLEVVKTFNGVKALSRKNFSTTARVENDDGTIHVYLGTGLELEISEQNKNFEQRYSKKCVCILKDTYLNRILYQGEAMNEIILWQAAAENKGMSPYVNRNLALSTSSVEIPDIKYNIQEEAKYALC